MTKYPVLSLPPLPALLHSHTSTPPQQNPFDRDVSEGVTVPPPVVTLKQRVLVSSKESKTPRHTHTHTHTHTHSHSNRDVVDKFQEFAVKKHLKHQGDKDVSIVTWT